MLPHLGGGIFQGVEIHVFQHHGSVLDAVHFLQAVPQHPGKAVLGQLGVEPGHFRLGFLQFGGEGGAFVHQLFRVVQLQGFGGLVEGVGVVLEQVQDIVAGNCFDPAHPGGHAAFANNLKQADVGGVGHMGAAAELLGEVVHTDHPGRCCRIFPQTEPWRRFSGLPQWAFPPPSPGWLQKSSG